jgi:hypothetical protein
MFPAIDFSLESISLLSIDKSFCGPLQFKWCPWHIVIYMNLLSLQVANDEDVLWVPDVKEAHKSVAARGMKFMDW